MYECPEGTIAPHLQSSTCTKCSSNRRNFDRDTCLLDDTPLDAIEIFTKKDLSFIISKSTPVFMSIYLRPSPYLNFTTQITFIGPEMDPQLLVFASTKTGNPSSSNYEFFGGGLNATVSVPQQLGSQFIIYFNLQATKRLKYFAKVFKPYDSMVTIDVNPFELYHPYTVQNWIMFQFNNITIGETVKFKLLMLNTFTNNVNIMYSTIPTLTYLNPNNANIVVRSENNRWIDLSFKQVNAHLEFESVHHKHCEQPFDLQLLLDGGYGSKNKTVETYNKVTFTMSKTVFKVIKPYFKLKEHVRYKETFLNHSKLNYMANDIWIKKVEYFGGFAIKDEQQHDGFKFIKDELVRIDIDNPEIYMKVSSDQSFGELHYKQALMSLEASKYIDGFTKCDQQYIIEVNRKKYQHLENSLAFLTKDDVLFQRRMLSLHLVESLILS